MSKSTYDFGDSSKSQHSKSPHLKARLPFVVVSSSGPLVLDCRLKETTPLHHYSSHEHNEYRQRRVGLLPAVSPPRQEPKQELGEFTCTQIKEAIVAMKITMFRQDTDPVLSDICIPYSTPCQALKPIHAHSHQRLPSALIPCTFTKNPSPSSRPPCRRIATAWVKPPARKFHPVQTTALPRLAPYAIGAVELHRAYPLSRTTTLHGRSLTT